MHARMHVVRAYVWMEAQLEVKGSLNIRLAKNEQKPLA